MPSGGEVGGGGDAVRQNMWERLGRSRDEAPPAQAF